MARFVRNPDGAVHSVSDEFEFPTDANGNVIGEWEDVEESEASAQLLGTEADPQVEAARLHLLAEQPVHEVVSSGHVGDDPETPMTDEEIARVEAAAAEPEQTPAPESTPDTEEAAE